MNHSVLILSLCLFCQGAEAQEAPTQAAPAAGASQSESSQVPAVYERVYTVIRYGEDGRGSKDTEARIRVQNFQGVQQVGQLVFSYNGSNERLEIRSLRVLKPDGNVVTSGSEAVVDLSVPAVQEAPIYSDARQKHVTVPGLSVGDIVEYEVVTHVFEALTPGQFWDGWDLVSDSVCLDEELVLNLPATRTVKVKNPEGVLPSVEESGGRRVYTWKTSNQKPREPFDFFRNFRFFDPAVILRGISPPPPRRMLFSTFLSWGEVGRWYGAMAGEPQSIVPEVRDKSQEITRGAQTPLAKVRAVYDFVSHIRYVSLSFGAGRYQPHAPSEVLANRYGDCKDKATLLDALLAAQGIPSATALVRSQAELDPEIPTPQQFDHAINVVSLEGEEIWLDSTSGLQPFGYLLPQYRGKAALVVRYPHKSDLENPQPSGTVPGSYRLDLELTIAEDGAQDAHVTLEVRGGDWEALLRLLLSRVSLAQYGQMFSDAAKQGAEGQNVAFTDLKNSDPYDTANPLRLEARYRRGPVRNGEPAKSATGAKMEPLLTPYWLVPMFPMPPPAREGGKNPVMLNGPQEFFLHVKLIHPPLPAATPVEPVHLTQDFAEYSLQGTADATTITVDAHLKLLVKELPPERSEDYASFKKSALKSLEPLAAAFLAAGRSTKAAVSSPPKPPSPGKPLLDSARSAAARRDYATSAQLYEQAVAKDPEYVEAWNSLGWTYNTLGLYQKAEAALRRALALDAKARFAHNNLGQALAGQKKYEDAISEYLEEIEINPKDQWAHANLGRVYLRVKQFGKAVPELETASTITPNDPAVFFNLGSAYAKTAQAEKALKAFEHSVELEPVPSRWNSVAYELALDKLALDEAQKYAESAIAATAEQMRQVSLNTVSSEDIRLPNRIAAYWDTLGWVRFQQGNLAAAEKYVNCAWQIRSRGEIGDHLGQIYERQGRKAEAIQTYELALASTEPSPETKERLWGLLGADADLESLTHQAKQRLAETRTVAIANTRKAEGIAEFWILLSPGPKVESTKFISGDEGLEPFAQEFASATYPDPFPEPTAIQLLRRGRLSCSASAAECRLLLEPADTVRSTN